MLTVDHLSVTFIMYTQKLAQKPLTVITDLDLKASAGQVTAVVGSSGSGKSLLAHAILGILPPNARSSGEMRFKNELLTPARQAALRGKEIALIPQSVAFLDPLMPIGAQVQRAAVLGGNNGQAAQAQQAAFRRYGLDEKAASLYPFQLSGGMARRALVSTAVVGHAHLVIADEPTPGLHPAAVDEALRHLRELADEGRAVVIITHDIDAALKVADQVAVFYAGTTLEVALAAAFSGEGQNLRHPYSRALWRALPQNDFTPVAGSQPPADDLPAGCLYATRCPLASPECLLARPGRKDFADGWVRCIHA